MVMNLIVSHLRSLHELVGLVDCDSEGSPVAISQLANRSEFVYFIKINLSSFTNFSFASRKSLFLLSVPFSSF